MVDGLTFTHRPDRSCTAAGRLVSSLHQGAAHAGRCVQFAVQRAVGFFIHARSVVTAALGRKPEIFQFQGGGL